MNIGVYYPPTFPLSMKIYADTVMRNLRSKDCSFLLFDSTSNIPQNVHLYWDPRVGGGALPAINKNNVVKPIVATLHGTALFTLPIKENCFSFTNIPSVMLNRIKYRNDWSKYENHFEKIITVSEYAKSEIIENLSINAERIEPIYHAADKELFYPKYNTNKPAFHDKYFLHVSVYQPKKNIDRIIKAYNLLALNEDIPRLILIAPNYKIAVENAKITLINHVISRKSVAKYMQNAYAFVFPSLHESFGLPILEAMTCGVPVITSIVTGCPEIAGGAALLVDPRNSKEIAKAIRKLSYNEIFRNELIQKGLKRAGEFCWQKSANKHYEVFNKLI